MIRNPAFFPPADSSARNNNTYIPFFPSIVLAVRGGLDED
jgi:hypothetical protein